MNQNRVLSAWMKITSQESLLLIRNFSGIADVGFLFILLAGINGSKTNQTMIAQSVGRTVC